jgi:hypothetical protein
VYISGAVMKNDTNYINGAAFVAQVLRIDPTSAHRPVLCFYFLLIWYLHNAMGGLNILAFQPKASIGFCDDSIKFHAPLS